MKKNLKKLLAFLLAATMVFSLSACGGDKTNDSKEEGQNGAAGGSEDGKEEAQS